MNFGALNKFDFFIKKLKKALDCINRTIYTHVVVFNLVPTYFGACMLNCLLEYLAYRASEQGLTVYVIIPDELYAIVFGHPCLNCVCH